MTRARLAVRIEYDGKAYSGWQVQHHAPSVQVALSEAIAQVANETIHCVGAGRTDAGVHATGQVAHFDTTATRKLRSWTLGINSNLPADICVHWVAMVPADFHARFSAKSRSYRYTILNREVRSPMARERAWWVRETLDIDAMRDAARVLLGRHDFSSFRASACQSKTPVRELTLVSIEKNDPWVHFDFSANAFLHHMVRNIIGTLVTVGHGEQPPQWVAEVLAKRDRTLAGVTAPPQGLCLTEIVYPDEFRLATRASRHW